MIVEVALHHRPQPFPGLGNPLMPTLAQLLPGALQICGVKSRGGSELRRPAFPEILKASAEFGAAEGDDGVGATSGPVHAGPFEPGPDDYFHPASRTPV